MLVKGGTVIDGTGSDRYEADVLIKDDKILEIGAGLTAPEEAVILDAGGKLVTPGFINMHAHSDCSVVMYPNMESTLGQGITTEFVGHCGLGVAPVEKYWLYMFPEKKAFTKVMPEPRGGINPYGAYVVPTDALRRVFPETYGEALDWSSYGEFLEHMRKVGMGANMAVVAGQAQFRMQAMGQDFKRGAAEEEIQYMERALEEAMEHGALGFSLGLDYQPGLYASHEELVRLMKVVAKRDGIVTAHTRSRDTDYYKGQNFLKGVQEFIQLGKESGARIHISHIQLGWETVPADDEFAYLAVEKMMRLLEEARKDGVTVTWDVIPKYAFGPFHYPMAASMFQPYVESCGGCRAFAETLKIDSYRKRIEDEIRSGNHASQGIFTRFDPKSNPDWDLDKWFTKSTVEGIAGKTIREAANGKDSLRFLLDVLEKDPYAAVMPYNRRPEHTPGRDAYVAQEDASIALDTWTFDYDAALTEGDMPLECGSPATYEGMTVFLELERDKGVPMEKTVKKLTGNAAKALRMPQIGEIGIGKQADLLVIDWDHFSAESNLADPRHGAKGMDYVIVNGQIAVDHGRHTHVRSGKILAMES